METVSFQYINLHEYQPYMYNRNNNMTLLKSRENVNIDTKSMVDHLSHSKKCCSCSFKNSSNSSVFPLYKCLKVNSVCVGV